MTITLGSLFSGIGLLDIGLERAGFQTIWQVERDKRLHPVLKRHFGVPIYKDIKQIDWSTVKRPDALAGGFPCQPFSRAGLMKGMADERWLWPEFDRAIRALRPQIVIVENVAALLGSPEWEIVLGDLAEAGYDAEWRVVRADELGSCHPRERIFISAFRQTA